MREITTHKINELNEQIRVTAEDLPGHGNAHHRYRVCVPMIDPVEHHVAENSRRSRSYCDINFQKGAIKEEGYNGISNESLLAVVADRLECFQTSEYRCDENQEALGHIKAAMAILHERTKKRMARGVEGTHKI